MIEHRSLVRDEEYDILYDKLQAVEKTQGWVDSDSPTSRVGHQSGKIKHPVSIIFTQKSL